MASASCGSKRQQGRNVCMYNLDMNNDNKCEPTKTDKFRNIVDTEITHLDRGYSCNFCNCSRKVFNTRTSKHLIYYLTIFLLLSGAEQASALFSKHRRPSSDWGIDDSESDSRLSSADIVNDPGDYATCMRGEYLEGYTLIGGTHAGEYKNLGVVQTFESCASLCCEDNNCNLAVMLTHLRSSVRNCFKVTCYDEYSDSCKSRSAPKSKYHPYVFRRGREMQKPMKGIVSRIKLISIDKISYFLFPLFDLIN